jgi:hypothetical protein
VSPNGFVDHLAGKIPSPEWQDGETLCPVCGTESCEEHLPSPQAKPNGRAADAGPTAPPSRYGRGLDAKFLDDAVKVATEGQAIQTTGIQYALDKIIPAYGMVGTLVAFAKVGKTTWGQQCGAAIAMDRTFLGRATQQRRVLVIAAEDPPDYTAWLARHLDVSPNVLTFYRASVQLDGDGLRQIAATVDAGQYGMVLISTWQSVVRSLVKDENDNAGMVRVVENVKAMTRELKVPWLIDAHSGKGENQHDDADPSQAMRGASSAAGAADYALSLRYVKSPFDSRRRLSGKGRFVNLPTQLIDYNSADGTYTAIGEAKTVGVETTWRLIVETGALTTELQSVTAIAARAWGKSTRDVTKGDRKHVTAALAGRDGVEATTKTRGQQTDKFYRLVAAW